MTPAMIAALKNPNLPKTGFFQIDFPSANTKRMMIGSGEAIWGGNTWKGYDSTIGHIDAADDISESNDGVAPNMSFSVVPSASADRTIICAPTIQLSRVQVWIAALTLDGSNHVAAVIDPEQVFDGYIDQVTLNGDENLDDIDYTLISCFDYFFEDSEGQRLNGAFHQSIWPGEKGMDNVTGLTKHMYWGADAPTGVTSGGNSSISPGGIGGLNREGGGIGTNPQL